MHLGAVTGSGILLVPPKASPSADRTPCADGNQGPESRVDSCSRSSMACSVATAQVRQKCPSFSWLPWSSSPCILLDTASLPALLPFARAAWKKAFPSWRLHTLHCCHGFSLCVLGLTAHESECCPVPWDVAEYLEWMCAQGRMDSWDLAQDVLPSVPRTRNQVRALYPWKQKVCSPRCSDTWASLQVKHPIRAKAECRNL